MVTCPVCDGTDTSAWETKAFTGALRPEDLRITDARYGTTLALATCRDCGFIFANDERVADLSALYEALDDPDYELGAEARTRQHRFILDLCREAHPHARTLLDVGAATGLLVIEGTERGLTAVGVEPSQQLSERARARGANVLSGVLPHPALANDSFDLVTLVDVVEHVRSPVSLLQAAAARLAPGGLVVVVTPDVRSVAARLLGPRWWHFRVAHVGYFSLKSFSRAAARAGLRVESQRRALWFFPVGYLLERVTRYVPALASTMAWLGNGALVTRLLTAVVPLNLLDSSVYFLRKCP